MKKRVIKVMAVYNLDDPALQNVEITKPEIVKENLYEGMNDIFGYDEGFELLYVDCEDVEV